MKIVKEGYKSIKFFLFFAIGFYIIGAFFVFLPFKILAFLCFAFSLFCFYFFRNPDIEINALENEIVSPCNGKVMEIVEEYNNVLEMQCKVIRIFLSVFDVHVQRTPIDGEIEYIEYKKGKFLAAMHPNAHIENEQNLVVFNDKEQKRRVMCIQIAGLIARKIVMWTKRGDVLKKGDLYGMIKFGSQVDIYLPVNTDIKINEKQKIVAGKTIIAIWE